MPGNKLISIERTINVYNNEGDELIEEHNIDEIPFEQLKAIVVPKEDDPLLYDGYVLTEDQLKALNNIMKDNKIMPDYTTCFYVLECSGMYDWQV
jgi:hypothetical protein